MRFTPAALVLVFGACDSAADPRAVNVDGLWNYTELLQDRLRGVSCNDTGTYRLRQIGDRFEGVYFQRGICLGTQSFFNTDSGFVSAGVVIGNTMKFTATPTCQYEGRLTGSPPGDVAGKGYCTLEINGLLHTFEGTWQATKEP
jgi:hypothetical protein